MSSKGKSWVWSRSERDESQRRIKESVRLANAFVDQKIAELKNQKRDKG
jgi:hypothetical protein